MPDIAVGLFDTIEAAMASGLTTFSTAQTTHFTVSRRPLRPIDRAELPLVVINCVSLTHEGSSSKWYEQETAEYNLDCFAVGVEGTYKSDEDAKKKLYFLAQQVKYALFALSAADFGQAKGTIAMKEWPDFTLLKPTKNEAEEQIVGGRWTIRVQYGFTAEDLTSQALTRLVLTEFLKQYAPQGGIDKTFP